ncbi:MAG: methylmalonyl Co-A mutase-associated GTPase MeaB [Spirochaetales bacterium]|nr:methylmalonyl Co-A mutase-associated GTPase MeaB [Spirochaetales bacterium]
MDLYSGVLAAEPRALARAITLVENRDPQAETLIDRLYPHTGRASMIGVTGSPGAGKSTLVDRLITRERAAGRKVAVIAVDPSSPFTGGAILGDRLRMQGHATDPGVFIRSMASRGSLGGVAAATGDAVRVLDAAGYDTVFIETIGVGQTEVRVVELSDLVLLVLMPGAGDEIQAMKAGVMEIGDIFVINKKDLPGADKLRLEVEYVLSFKDPEKRSGNPVVMASAVNDQGIGELGAALDSRLADSRADGSLEQRRRFRIGRELEGILSRKIHELLDVHVEFSKQMGGWIDSLYRGRARPYNLVDQQIQRFLKNNRKETDP